MITTTYIASLIFFNARRALGTWLRVGKDPIRCLRLVLTLLLPLCKMRTHNWSMWLLPTFETEACLAYVALGIATHVREHPSPACLQRASTPHFSCTFSGLSKKVWKRRSFAHLCSRSKTHAAPGGAPRTSTASWTKSFMTGFNSSAGSMRIPYPSTPHQNNKVEGVSE